MDSNYAEILALLKAIELSVDNEVICCQPLMFELDSSNAISWFEDPDNRPCKYASNFNKIQQLVNKLNNPIFIHTPRSANSVADSLAKEGVSRAVDLVAWFST